MEIFTETPFSGSKLAALFSQQYEEPAWPDWGLLGYWMTAA
jgi:hypothetical protein